MAQITFTDPYLKKDVTPARVDQATNDVAALGPFPQSWIDRMTELRTYVIICQECVAAADDIYSVKLKAYATEYATSLAAARSAQQAANPTTPGISSALSIPILRA